MSGCSGGTRIGRDKVEPTVKSYVDKVLSNFPTYKSKVISGSYNYSLKNDFGDIDLIIYLDDNNKTAAKSALSNYLTTLSDEIIVPFKSAKYQGKKCLKTGELVSVLYPIENSENEFIQIDNIISISQEELLFKQAFLNYPADKQGLLLGLAKVLMIEEDRRDIFERLNIINNFKLANNQEFEFNLSSSGLTLRIVTLTDIYREINRVVVWQSSNWDNVQKLFHNFNIDGSFDELLNEIVTKLKNPRSKNRIKGIFRSMVTIKTGEVGTNKAVEKQRALDKIKEC